MDTYFPLDLEDADSAESLRVAKELLPYTPLEYREEFVEAFHAAWQGFEFLPTRFSSLGFNGSE